MKRMIKSNLAIHASNNDVVLKSNDGLFQLVTRKGVGIEDTPWQGYEVESMGDVDKYVVEIRLVPRWANFEGPDHPVTYEYYDVYVAHGMSSRRENLDETKRYIEVLKSAVDFAYEVKKYLDI